jgi:hypothetical protein
VQISNRDRATLIRLQRCLGTAALHRLIDDLPTDGHTGRGAPREPRLRQSLAVALFALWQCRDRKKSWGSFPTTIRRIVEIQYARRGSAYKPCFPTDDALRKDVERGLAHPDERQIANMLQCFVGWRRDHVDARWGFLIGGGAPTRNALVTVKRPEILFALIDAALLRAKSGQ